jgi:magnesium-dependent phosphatase-1
MTDVIFAFELDFTVWNFENLGHDQMETPLKKDQEDIVDAKGRRLKLLPEIKTIFDRIKHAGYKIVLTSRTIYPDLTHDLVQMLGLDQYTELTIFNKENKNKQLAEISTQTGIPVKHIIYYDTIKRNIEDIKPTGACTFLIPDNGLNLDTFEISMKNACLSFTLDLDRLGITWGHK